MPSSAGRRGAAAASLTGLGGGLFSGLTGVGGGAVMVPLMTGVLGMRQHAAHGTSLVVIVFAAGASAVIYAAGRGIDWPLVAALLPTSLVGAYAGARLVHHLPELRLRQLFALFVLCVGLRMLLFGDAGALLSVSGPGFVSAAGLIGMAGGMLAGALGVGGGAIFVPALVLVLGAGQHEAQGVSLCVIAAAAAVGSLTHYRQGAVDTRAAAWIVPVSVPAGIGGALIASSLGAGTLQQIFAVVAVGVGAHMLISATRTIRRMRSATAVAVSAEAVA